MTMMTNPIQDESLVRSFMSDAGDSLKTFRYFGKRPFSVIAEHAITLIGKTNDKPVAYGHLTKDGWLGVCVKFTEKGKGYGKEMVMQLMKRAKSLGFDKVFLIVDKNNIVARRLYEKSGFRQTEATPDGKIYCEAQIP